MHDPTKEGNAFFVCDFCRNHWAEDRPMIEGHRGSLVCGRCLSVGLVAVRTGSGAAEPALAAGLTCTMCLEQRGRPDRSGGPEALWCSPLHPEAVLCRRCAEQAAEALLSDPESGWSEPPTGV